MSQSMGLKRRERDRTTKSGEGKTSRARLGNEETGRRTLNGAIDKFCKSPGGSSDSKTTGSSDLGLKGEFSAFGKERETLNECGNEPSIITGCDPKEFKRVVSRISNNRIIVISEMGLGPVHNFRCGKVNLSLCEMLLNNFDVKNQTIEIHGRHMSITVKDFDRLMGLRCHGTEVDIVSVTDGCEVSELKDRLCGDDTEINLQRLKKTVVFTDDDELFMVSFSLFALATMFCPSTPGYVDPRFLVLLRNPRAIGTYNWGQFAYTKLLEGVTSYQSGDHCPILGCLAFLQVFYLSVLGERMFIVPRCVLPVMGWGVKESKRVFQRVKELGGFYAKQGIWVTKKYASVRASECSGSRDMSTGLKKNLYDDTADLKKELGVLEEEICILDSTFRSLGPDLANLRRAVTALHKVVVKREGESPSCPVSPVKRGYCDSAMDLEGFTEERPKQCPFKGETVSGNLKDPLEKETSAQIRAGNNIGVVTKPGRIMFGRPANISPKEGELLKYLFRYKGTAEDILGSNEVARFMDATVSRRQLMCLCPKHCLNSQVINIMGGYLFAKSTDRLYLPTFFSERAKLGACSAVWEAHLSATIMSCGLRRFYGAYEKSEKIFIPILDSEDEHWYLAVLTNSGDCEIWDSKPDLASQQRRKDYVISAIDLLLAVFADELRHCPWPCSESASFTFTYPACSEIQLNKYDSGIFVIRNMQFYNQRWYEGFNSGDQRIRIALEIVNNPLNECLDAVWDSVDLEQKMVGYSQLSRRSDNPDAEPVRVGMKLKPRVPRR